MLLSIRWKPSFLLADGITILYLCSFGRSINTFNKKKKIKKERKETRIRQLYMSFPNPQFIIQTSKNTWFLLKVEVAAAGGVAVTLFGELWTPCDMFTAKISPLKTSGVQCGCFDLT